MAKDFNTLEDSNRSANASVHTVSSAARRQWLHGGLGAAMAAAFGPLAAGMSGCAAGPGTSGSPSALAISPKLGFRPVPPSRADQVVVPEGYSAQVIAAWGEPVGVPGAMPAWRPDASNSAADQALQLGMHHDGMHFFPLDDAEGTTHVNKSPAASRHGLLVMNHEYIDDGLLHAGGVADWSAEKVRKAQAAHGVSVIEVALGSDGWQLVRPSPHARRFTANTPFAVAGPAAGHALLQTTADPSGRRVLGTLNNCAAGQTPWGTYLSGEENWAGYFNGPAEPDAHQARWGIRPSTYNRWHDHDARFDAVKHPNEPNRFGWVVEIDPHDPSSSPVKRTALGRAAHEGAWVATTRDGRAVVYSGEDARFEYIYKFVSRDRIAPGGAKANATLLDHGTLHVARFDADGRGRWLPLVWGQGPLTAANGFADQGEVLIKARQASDALGATKMDRPEWLAIDHHTHEVFCSLTNNSQRGRDGRPGPDAANPRANNVMGQIIRWVDGEGSNADFDATTLRWNHLVLAGDPANARPQAQGNVHGDLFACPDGLTIDGRGVLWIQTDMSPSAMHQGEMAGFGNNQMLACDPSSGEIRRFLTGPVGCEISGCSFTPDGRSMFINVQHPGETPNYRSDPTQPTRFSSWPDGPGAARPRSATVVIRKRDGGVIGT